MTTLERNHFGHSIWKNRNFGEAYWVQYGMNVANMVHFRPQCIGKYMGLDDRLPRIDCNYPPPMFVVLVHCEEAKPLPNEVTGSCEVLVHNIRKACLSWLVTGRTGI